MKKILLAFVFLPLLSFAQESSTEINKLYSLHPKAKYIRSTTEPAYFVDGERVYGDVLPKMNPDDIEHITVIKTDKKYPNGRVEIILKKKKES